MPAGPAEGACGSSGFPQQKVQPESVLATQAVTGGDRRLGYSKVLQLPQLLS